MRCVTGQREKMIKCPICKKQTAPGESTGKYNTIVDVVGTTGKRILKSEIVCMGCNGEGLSK